MKTRDHIAVGVWLIIVIGAGITLGRIITPGLVNIRNQKPAVVIQLDTIYAPPPGFIEGFRLECRWVPDTLSGEEG